MASTKRRLYQVRSDVSQLEIQGTDAKLETKLRMTEQHITDAQNKLTFLLKRIHEVESRVIACDRQASSTLANYGRGDLRWEIAESITAIVGLKEATTSPNRVLRYAWSILLFLGVLATAFFVYNTAREYLADPTGTFIKLRTQSTYDFPPMLLCPYSWLDEAKAKNRGISDEALKYSFGYFEYFDTPYQVQNVTKARQEFLEFFEAKNYSDLNEFFKSFTTNLKPYYSLQAVANASEPSFFCDSCADNFTLERVFMDGWMCYFFSLRSTKPGAGRKGKVVVIKHRSFSANWELYFPTDLDVLTQILPPITLRSGFRNVIKLNTIQLSTLDKKRSDDHCVEPHEVPENYSSDQCMAECKNHQYQSVWDCDFLPLSSIQDKHPTQLCNAYDGMPGRNITYSEFMQSKEAGDLTSKQKCFEACPYRCDRTIYEATLHSETEIDSEEFFGIRQSAKEMNMSVAYLKVLHSAVYQGGIMTLTEISTYSFTNFINNVGGTLGLFVGGTIMTFVQLFMFCVQYCCVRK